MAYNGRRPSPVELHVAIDTSRSMKAYAPSLLTFAYFLQRQYGGKVASYALGTNCTPLNKKTSGNLVWSCQC